MKNLLLILCAITGISCSFDRSLSDSEKELISLFEGTFCTTDQSIADSNYLDITLFNHRIITSENDRLYFYSEQYITANPIQAYSQKIYSFQEINSTNFKVDLYIIDNFHLYRSTEESLAKIESIDIEELIFQRGCRFDAVKTEKGWKIETSNKKCISSLNKAEYSKIDIELLPNLILDSSCGINADGNKVWGPKDQYVFKRKAAW